MHIRLIRVLQGLGLSLPEIHRYFDDAAQLSEQIDRLVLLRDQLDRFIAQLRLRQQAAKPEICPGGAAGLHRPVPAFLRHGYGCQGDPAAHGVY